MPNKTKEEHTFPMHFSTRSGGSGLLALAFQKECQVLHKRESKKLFLARNMIFLGLPKDMKSSKGQDVEGFRFDLYLEMR